MGPRYLLAKIMAKTITSKMSCSNPSYSKLMPLSPLERKKSPPLYLGALSTWVWWSQMGKETLKNPARFFPSSKLMARS